MLANNASNLSGTATLTFTAAGGQTTTATLNLKVLQAVQRPDNTPYTAYQRFLVQINNHDFSGGTSGY